MPTRSGKNIFGFIDPISILGVLFLVVTLAIGTVVTTNKDFKLNIAEKAGGTCGYCSGATCVSCSGGKISVGECSSNNQCGGGGSCGNGLCQAGESPQTCPNDCMTTGGPYCGDGNCNGNETPGSCDTDCGDEGPACQPSCGGRACGDDGCGDICGSCILPATCSSSGQCTVTCTPSCTGKQCGNNGCGGSCGTCNGGSTCISNACVVNATPVPPNDPVVTVPPVIIVPPVTDPVTPPVPPVTTEQTNEDLSRDCFYSGGQWNNITKTCFNPDILDVGNEANELIANNPIINPPADDYDIESQRNRQDNSSANIVIPPSVTTPKYTSKAECQANVNPNSKAYDACGQYASSTENQNVILQNTQNLLASLSQIPTNYVSYWQNQTGNQEVNFTNFALATYKMITPDFIANPVLERFNLRDEADSYLDIAFNQQTTLDTADLITFDKTSRYVSNYQRINEQTYSSNSPDIVNYLNSFNAGVRDKETLASTIDLGVTISEELYLLGIAGPIALTSGGVIPSAVSLMGQAQVISTVSQGSDATTYCLLNGFDENCEQKIGRTGLSVATIGVSQYANTFSNALGRVANTVTTGANFAVDSADAVVAFSDPNTDALTRAMSIVAVVGDIGGGIMDFNQGQLDNLTTFKADVATIKADLTDLTTTENIIKNYVPKVGEFTPNTSEIPLVEIADTPARAPGVEVGNTKDGWVSVFSEFLDDPLGQKPPKVVVDTKPIVADAPEIDKVDSSVSNLNNDIPVNDDTIVDKFKIWINTALNPQAELKDVIAQINNGELSPQAADELLQPHIFKDSNYLPSTEALDVANALDSGQATIIREINSGGNVKTLQVQYNGKTYAVKRPKAKGAFDSYGDYHSRVSEGDLIFYNQVKPETLDSGKLKIDNTQNLVDADNNPVSVQRWVEGKNPDKETLTKINQELLENRLILADNYNPTNYVIDTYGNVHVIDTEGFYPTEDSTMASAMKAIFGDLFEKRDTDTPSLFAEFEDPPLKQTTSKITDADIPASLPEVKPADVPVVERITDWIDDNVIIIKEKRNVIDLDAPNIRGNEIIASTPKINLADQQIPTLPKNIPGTLNLDTVRLMPSSSEFSLNPSKPTIEKYTTRNGGPPPEKIDLSDALPRDLNGPQQAIIDFSLGTMTRQQLEKAIVDFYGDRVTYEFVDFDTLKNISPTAQLGVTGIRTKDKIAKIFLLDPAEVSRVYGITYDEAVLAQLQTLGHELGEAYDGMVRTNPLDPWASEIRARTFDQIFIEKLGLQTNPMFKQQFDEVEAFLKQIESQSKVNTSPPIYIKVQEQFKKLFDNSKTKSESATDQVQKTTLSGRLISIYEKNLNVSSTAKFKDLKAEDLLPYQFQRDIILLIKNKAPIEDIIKSVNVAIDKVSKYVPVKQLTTSEVKVRANGCGGVCFTQTFYENVKAGFGFKKVTTVYKPVEVVIEKPPTNPTRDRRGVEAWAQLSGHELGHAIDFLTWKPRVDGKASLSSFLAWRVKSEVKQYAYSYIIDNIVGNDRNIREIESFLKRFGLKDPQQLLKLFDNNK